MNAINYIKSKITPAAEALGWAAKETFNEIYSFLPDVFYGVSDANDYASIPCMWRETKRQLINLTLSTPIESEQTLNGSFRISDSWITATKISVGLLSGCTILNSYAQNRDLAFPLLAPVYGITASMIGENEVIQSAAYGAVFALSIVTAFTFSSYVFRFLGPNPLR